jgi:hypothetical protein
MDQACPFTQHAISTQTRACQFGKYPQTCKGFFDSKANEFSISCLSILYNLSIDQVLEKLSNVRTVCSTLPRFTVAREQTTATTNVLEFTRQNALSTTRGSSMNAQAGVGSVWSDKALGWYVLGGVLVVVPLLMFVVLRWRRAHRQGNTLNSNAPVMVSSQRDPSVTIQTYHNPTFSFDRPSDVAAATDIDNSFHRLSCRYGGEQFVFGTDVDTGLLAIAEGHVVKHNGQALPNMDSRV